MMLNGVELVCSNPIAVRATPSWREIMKPAMGERKLRREREKGGEREG
jgi:hypothetical protein